MVTKSAPSWYYPLHLGTRRAKWYTWLGSKPDKITVWLVVKLPSIGIFGVAAARSLVKFYLTSGWFIGIPADNQLCSDLARGKTTGGMVPWELWGAEFGVAECQLRVKRWGSLWASLPSLSRPLTTSKYLVWADNPRSSSEWAPFSGATRTSSWAALECPLDSK